MVDLLIFGLITFAVMMCILFILIGAYSTKKKKISVRTNLPPIGEPEIYLTKSPTVDLPGEPEMYLDMTKSPTVVCPAKQSRQKLQSKKIKISEPHNYPASDKTADVPPTPEFWNGGNK